MEKSIIHEPFDPSMIEVEIKNFTVKTLVEMMENNLIDLAPDFQRNGDIWPDTQKSRLIESLILGLPLPSFYFSHDSKSKKWIVIDGLQRLNTLKVFMIDKRLKLKNLEFLGELYNNWGYSDFPFTDRLNMGMLTVTVNIIKGNTPAKVKYILFKRINSAGTPLTPQEVRHALNQGPASKLLLRLAENPLFKKMVKVDSQRMADCEYVLRFIAFSHGNYAGYRNRMDDFLNDWMSKINTYDEIELSKIGEDFQECLELWDCVLDNMAFRNPTLTRNRGVSKALYDMLMTTAMLLSAEERAALISNRDEFTKEYHKLFTNDVFQNLLANGTSKYSKISRRNDMALAAIRNSINQ